MAPPSIVGALTKAGLATVTGEVIKPDQSPAFTKIGLLMDSLHSCVPQLSAHNMGIVIIPAVITYRAPGTYTVHLDAPFKWAIFTIR